MRRTSAFAIVLGALLVAPTAGASTLLDTLTVDPSATSPATGKVTLHPGTRYSLDVSGTFQETGREGYGFRYDTLYCYEGVGFDASVPPQCPHSGSNDKSSRGDQIGVRVGSGGKIAPPDWFGSTSGPSRASEVPYDPNHSYSFRFFAPSTGVLQAGGPHGFEACPTCETTYGGGPIVIKVFGPSTSSGGGGGGGGGGGSGGTTKNVQPLAVPDGGPVQCVTATRATVFAAANGPCPFGKVAVKAAPPSGTPVATDSAKLPAKTRSVTGFIKLDQAAIDNEAGWVVDKLDPDTGDRKFRDLFEGCLLFGGVEPEADFLSIKDDRERVVYFVCAQITLGNLRRTGRRAHAAASACHAVWVPIFKAHSKVTRREYRKVIAAHNRMQKAQCRFGPTGGMTYSVVARHRSLNKALGGSARAGFGRLSSQPDGAGARLRYSWATT